MGDVDRGTMNRLEGEGALNALPLWTPDGSRITFASRRGSPVQNTYWVRADGSGGMERLTTSEFNQVILDWSPDGKTLVFYESNPTSGHDLWTLTASRPRLLFEGRYEISFLVSGIRFYEVSPDGQRFLMVKSDTPTAPRQLHLVVNWFEGLKRLVPARR